MADITITPALVVPQAGAKIDRSTVAAVAISAGDVVYKDAATGNKLRKCLSTTTAAAAKAYGIAVNTAEGANQPCAVCTSGRIFLSGNLLPGQAVAIGSAAGKIGLVSDVGEGDFVTYLGCCRDNGYLDVLIDSSGLPQSLSEITILSAQKTGQSVDKALVVFSNTISAGDFENGDFTSNPSSETSGEVTQVNPTTIEVNFGGTIEEDTDLDYAGDVPGIATPQNVNY